MFLLGICSFLQITFLPGFIAVRLAGIRGTIRTLVFSFALSMIINYVLVLLLFNADLYKNLAVVFIFSVEVLVVAKLLYPSLTAPIFSPASLAGFFSAWTGRQNNGSRQWIAAAGRTLVLLAALAGVAWSFRLFLMGIGHIFTEWDPLFSWNPWALSWYSGSLPHHTLRYPQLLPINWSLTYLFMNSRLEFFAKAAMPLFALYILLLILDLGIEKRSFGYLIGVPVASLIIRTLEAPFLGSGYADVPVSFFSFLAVYCLLAAPARGASGTQKKYLILGAIFAAEAAVTKQAGLLVACLYPLLAYVIVMRQSPTFRAERVWMLVVSCAIIIVIAAPWYVFKEGQIRKGIEANEFTVVNSLATPGDALRRLSDKIGLSFLVFGLGIPLLFSLRDRDYRWITLLIVFPMTASWVRYFGYDFRNLSTALPFVGAGVGVGVEGAYRAVTGILGGRPATVPLELQGLSQQALEVAPPQQSRAKHAALPSLKLYHLLLLGGVLIGIMAYQYSSSFLEERQVSLKKTLGDPKINELLYRYQKTIGLEGKILTNYRHLSLLPGLETHFKHERFRDYASYDRQLNNPEVQYIFILTYPGWKVDKRVYDDIDEKVKTGKYSVISDASLMRFLKIERDRR